MNKLAVAAALLTALSSWAYAADTAPVKVETGTLVGVSVDGVESFKGIPYAAPPVGNLRWRAPQPAAAWTGTRKADAYGKSCMQAERPGTGFIARKDMSEDCLTLNIFRSANAKDPLPVMVWIHGGALVTGGSSVPVYDGTAFAKGGVVLVSINYRLGRLGYFAHPALSAENADQGRLANYGLMDQIAALQWVQRNIATFGGDAKNVTIFGESAGGLSVNGLMIAPEARGLFHKAISQSGYGRGYFTRVSQATPDGRKSGEAEGIEYAAAIGLTDPTLADLRAASADKIADTATGTAQLNFYIDGKTMPHDMWQAFRDGKEAPVPFMLGSNGLEFPNSAPGQRVVAEFLSPAEEEALKPFYGERPSSIDHLGSDILFTQQARALARMHIKNGHTAYVYMFDVIPTEDTATKKGATHADELPYVFMNLPSFRKPITGKDNEAISTLMNAQWRAFAASGTPNGATLPKWPAYDGQQIMEYKLNGAAARPDARNARLDALGKIIDPKS